MSDVYPVNKSEIEAGMYIRALHEKYNEVFLVCPINEDYDIWVCQDLDDEYHVICLNDCTEFFRR